MSEGCSLWVRRVSDPAQYEIWCDTHQEVVSRMVAGHRGGDLQAGLLGVQRHMSLRKGEFLSPRTGKLPCGTCGCEWYVEHGTGERVCVDCGVVYV